MAFCRLRSIGTPLGRVERPAVDLDRDSLLGECDVDFVAADRIVRPPARDARFPQQFHQQAFGLRPRAVRSGLQQAARRGGAVATLVAQVCSPQLRQFDMTLQCRVHQLGAAASSNGRLDDRQWQRRNPQSVSLDDIGGRQIPPSYADVVSPPAVAVSGDRNFNEVGGELREAVPPSRGQPAGGGSAAHTPTLLPVFVRHL